jgi:hypothetical protein
MASDEKSRIGELGERLYTPGEAFPERRETFTGILGEKNKQQVPPGIPPRPPARVSSFFSKRRFPDFRTIVLWSGSALFLLLMAGGLYYVFFRGPTFFRRDVALSLSVPQTVRSGEDFELKVLIANNTPFPLKDGELALVFPEGALVEGEPRTKETRAVGALDVKAERRAVVSVRLLGPKDAAKSFSARFTYRPGTVASRFENTAETATTLTSAPIAFSLDLPKEAFPKSEARYVLKYENTAGVALPETAIRVEYPKDFSVTRTAPAPTQSAEWNLGQLKADASGVITIDGVFPDLELDQEFRATLGILADDQFIPYGEVAGVTHIIKPFLELDPTANGKESYPATPGERISYAVRWRNTGSVGLENIVIRARLVGAYFDLSSVSPRDGVFDGRTNEIAWTSRTVPALAIAGPNATDAVHFEVNIKSGILSVLSQEKELSVSVIWTIETTTVPPEFHFKRIASEAKIETPISSRVELNALGFFAEPSSTIANSGPIPPRVNETTTYTIHWTLKTFTNPVERIEVSAFLAPGVEFTGKTAVLKGDVPAPSFDSTTGEVTWNIDKLPFGVGAGTPAVEAAFQVALTPSLLQKNTSPLLVSDSRLIAVDGFTGVRLQAQSPRITTSLPNDPAVGEGGGTVQ